MMTQTPSANGPTAEQKDIPVQTSKPAVQTSVPARVQTSPAPPPEDLYTYEKCTIMLVMQLRPQQQENGSRSVLLSVQNGTGNKEELPLYCLLASEEELGGPLPPALTALLEALRQDLPARKLRHEQRAVRKASAGGATRPAQKPGGHTPAKDVKKKSGTATTTASPPPVPTAAHPLPKEGLVLGGLFDDL
jgi:hypothetical protein